MIGGYALLGDIISYTFFLFGLGCFIPNGILAVYLRAQSKKFDKYVYKFFFLTLFLDLLVSGILVGHLINNEFVNPFRFFQIFAAYLLIKFLIIAFWLRDSLKGSSRLFCFSSAVVFFIFQSLCFASSVYLISQDRYSPLAKHQSVETFKYSNLALYKDRLYVAKEGEGLFSYSPETGWVKEGSLPKKIYQTKLIFSDNFLFLTGPDLRKSSSYPLPHGNFLWTSRGFEELRVDMSLQSILELDSSEEIWMKFLSKYGDKYYFYSYHPGSGSIGITDMIRDHDLWPNDFPVYAKGKWYVINNDNTWVIIDAQTDKVEFFTEDPFGFMEPKPVLGPVPRMVGFEDRLYISSDQKIYVFDGNKWELLSNLDPLAQGILQIAGGGDHPAYALVQFPLGLALAKMGSDRKFSMETDLPVGVTADYFILWRQTPVVSSSDTAYLYRNRQWAPLPYP